MYMKVYLSENIASLGLERQIEVAFNIAETLDETLDTAQIVLAAEDRQAPYKPMSKITVYLDDYGTEQLVFYLVSDSVEVFSLNPLKYKHTLNIIQNTKLLSKYTVRNSVFTQPASKYKESFTGSYFTLSQATIEGSTNYATLIKLPNANELSRVEKLTLTDKEKVKETYIQIDVQVGVKPQGDDTHATLQQPKSLTELNTYFTNSVKIDHLYLHYTLNGSDYSSPLSLSDIGGTWLFNQKLQCDEIKDKINLGATNLFICSHDDGTYIDRCLFTNNNSGKFYPDDGITPAFFIIQFKIVAETYYYTVYDILDLLIKRQKQENDTTSKTALFNLPESGELYNLLTSTIAPNFTFTQCTMFDCLSEVFKLFDATFTLDSNNVLGIEYLNDNKTVTPNTDYSSLNVSVSEDKYNNGLISYYQDARTIEKYPAQKETYTKPRCSDLGVPQETDHYFITPHPIHNVIEFKLNARINIPRRYPGGTTNYWSCNGTIPVDMSHNILPQSIWTSLSVDSNFSFVNIRQNNSIYFIPGDNKIQVAWTSKTWLGITFSAFVRAANYSLGRMLNVNDSWLSSNEVPYVLDLGTIPVWNNLQLSVIYETTISGKARVDSYVNKFEGDTYITQDNGAVDLNKLGLNMLGLSYKLGEPTRKATKKILNWSDRILKGTYVLIDGEKWVANICTYTFFNDKIIENIEFVKNYNALAQRTRLLREKRYTNISQDLVLKSEDIIMEYCYFSSSNITASDDTTLMNKSYMFEYLIKGTFSNSNYNIEFGVMDVGLAYSYIPLVKYGFGNCICFEINYDSPISAGNYTQVTTGWWSETKYFTQAFRYTDENGFRDTANIKLVSGVENSFINMPLVLPIQINDTLVNIPNLKLYKQPNEIFALNYEVCFLPINKDVDFIGSEFINNNNAVSDFMGNKDFYLYYTLTDSDFQYSILDIKGEGSRVKITNITRILDNIVFTHSEVANIKTWAICDSNGNILFSSNNSENGNTTNKILYFKFRHNRI